MPICLTETDQADTLRERISELEEENARLRSLEKVVRRNTALFEALLANNSGGIALLGPQRRIVRAVRPLDGFSAGELAGKLVDTLVPFEDQAILIECYERIVQRQAGRAEFEVRSFRPDGTLRWLSVTLTDMLDDPNVQAIVCNVDDITERTHLELMVAESAVLAENSEWAVFSHDLEGKILTWNNVAEKVFGYTPGEIVGKHIAMLAPSEDWGEDRDEGLQEEEFRATRLRKNGEAVPVVVKLARFVNKSGHTRAISHFVKVLKVLSAGTGYPVPVDRHTESSAGPAN